MGTYRSRDLAAATGVTQRVIRFYVERRLLPPPSGRGTGPVYSDEHLLRLRAVLRLRAQRVSLDDIAHRLSRLTPAELATLGAPEAAQVPTPPPEPDPAPKPDPVSAPPPQPAQVLAPPPEPDPAPGPNPVSTPTPQPAQVPAPSPEPDPAPRPDPLSAPPPQPAQVPAPPHQPAPSYPAERWERVVLVPGLELHVRADAGELLRRLAEEIHTRYGVTSAAPAAAMDHSTRRSNVGNRSSGDGSPRM